jgi:hypothetical protein
MQDIARRSVLGDAVKTLDPIRQHPGYQRLCAILGRDVNTLVCGSRLDGDRRFEGRF